MSHLRFSIIIPTYNRAKYIGKAICSALQQMLPEDELIVIDDGSEDETPTVLSDFGNRIKVIQGGHSGSGRARNLGVEQARNELIAFLDDDDIWLPNKLIIQRSFMERRPDILFCFTNFEVEFSDGLVQARFLDQWERDFKTYAEAFGIGFKYSSIAHLPNGISDFWVYEGDLYKLQLTGFYVLTDTLVVRRQEAGNELYFSEDLKTYTDIECFYRLSRKGKGALLDIETVRQLDHSHGRLSQCEIVDKIDARIVLIRRIWGADRKFISRYSDLYRHTLDDLLSRKAGLLLSRGENRLAREALAEMHSPSPLLRLLSRFPSSLTMKVLKMYRILKNKIIRSLIYGKSIKE